MAVFAIHITDDPTNSAKSKLEKHYQEPLHYQIAENSYLIRSNSIAQTLAETIGIDGSAGETGPKGVVFKLNAAYAGFNDRSIWEWLSEAENQ
ncbi:MAG: hypothetical protein OXE93_00960 [bacterium]|nr:hypothetical protein [bacterium]